MRGVGGWGLESGWALLRFRTIYIHIYQLPKYILYIFKRGLEDELNYICK